MFWSAGTNQQGTASDFRDEQGSEPVRDGKLMELLIHFQGFQQLKVQKVPQNRAKKFQIAAPWAHASSYTGQLCIL